MLVPVVDARLHAPHELLERPQTVPVRRREADGPVREEGLVDGLLGPGLAEERGRGVVERLFQLEVLVAEASEGELHAGHVVENEGW